MGILYPLFIPRQWTNFLTSSFLPWFKSRLSLQPLSVMFFKLTGHIRRCDAFGLHQHQEVIDQVGNLLDETLIRL